MNTTDRVKVKIDLNCVAKNLRTSDGAAASEGTARSFIVYAGFNPDEDGRWIGPRAALRRFNPGEVVGVEAMQDKIPVHELTRMNTNGKARKIQG
ncbi:MAG TPA: hypothetical protein VFE47_28005 [Tepidisphaeraceae bacterium]|nr:hypothetical protein [Tepidisphaeraceae bacterium]